MRSPSDPLASDGLDAELYHLVAEGTAWGFALCSHDGRLVACNRKLAELWGFTTEEVQRIEALGQTSQAHEALLATMQRHVADPATPLCAPTDGARAAAEITLRDGRILERAVTPAALGVVGSFRDVTRRSRAEQLLREQARQQAALAALGELAVNTEELEPLLHAACATACDVLAADAAALVEPSPRGAVVRASVGLPRGANGGVDLSAGAVLPGADDGLAPLLRALGLPAALEVTLPGARAGRLGVYQRIERTFSGEELRFLETAASILAAALARHGAEQDVLDRERQLRAVFDGALDAMLIVDDGAVIRDANRAAAALLETSRAELLGRSLLDVAPGAAGRFDPTASGKPVGGEADVVLAGGRRRAVEFAGVPRILPGRHLGVMRDASERKQLHARLALADRMVSVGTLAAGVAHELNNPLAYVNANLSFLAERLSRVGELLGSAGGLAPADADLMDQVSEAITDARDGAERMRVIVRDLKTFSRADEEKSGPVALRPVIESCVNMAWNEIRHRARLVKDLADVPPVTANEARLGQVFLNLVVNAAQAIPEGHADDNEIRLTARTAPDGRVVIEVKDSGCGIPPEHLPRIFDPFFTTKAPGVGTGLGLAICHSIVTGIGGEIAVESGARGSTFRVLLPPAPPVVDAAPPAAASPAPRPRGRILVVDDEPLVGAVLQRTLQRDHDIVVVESARAALERLAERRFDLVLSDLLMPEMSGMDLYDALAARDPGLARRVVFLTGGAFTPAARAFLERESVLCVEKPFELAGIRAVLARKLAELGPAG